MKYLPDAANKPKIKLHFYTKYIALLIDEILYCIKEIAGHILMCALVKHTRIPFSKTVNFLCLCTFFLFLSVFALFSGFSSFSFSEKISSLLLCPRMWTGQAIYIQSYNHIKNILGIYLLSQNILI